MPCPRGGTLRRAREEAFLLARKEAPMQNLRGGPMSLPLPWAHTSTSSAVCTRQRHLPRIKVRNI